MANVDLVLLYFGANSLPNPPSNQNMNMMMLCRNLNLAFFVSGRGLYQGINSLTDIRQQAWENNLTEKNYLKRFSICFIV